MHCFYKQSRIDCKSLPFEVNLQREKSVEEMAFNAADSISKNDPIDHSMLLCCKIFISGARDRVALKKIEQAAELNSETVLVNKFPDSIYNIVTFTLVSYVVHDKKGNPVYSPLKQTVVAMCEASYQYINLEVQSGTHPRLGVIDDVLINPLARASLDEAAWLARTLAKEIGHLFQVPVFLSAAAHPAGKALDKIRRDLDYFRPNLMGKLCSGWEKPETLTMTPDEGPSKVPRSRGICMVGAQPWTAFYNIPIMSTDLSAVRQIARMVSGRGGGLPTVQALGLAHGDDMTEIACMLLDPYRVGADRVQHWVEMLASREGLDVQKGYFTDIPPEMLVEKYLSTISGHNSQGLVEV